METVRFTKAVPVFSPQHFSENAVTHFGFYTVVDTNGRDIHSSLMRLTAKNVYRLYINGDMVMHGPARTAHGYARVDEVDISAYLLDGINHVAIEVMVYGDCYNGYSNDSTLEGGMLIAELEADGEILTATGDDGWRVTHLSARAPRSERITHSRECAEVYFLNEEYRLWKMGQGSFTATQALPVEDQPVYLTHRALLPTLEETPIRQLVDFGSCYIDAGKPLAPLFYEKNSPYYDSLPEYSLADCRRTVELSFGGVQVERKGESLVLEGEGDQFVIFDGQESRVGFIGISFDCAHAGAVDIVHSELLDLDGSIPYYHNVVTRLHVQAGRTDFVTMEPALVRYVKIYFRGTGEIRLHSLSVYDDAYPDEMRSGFQCSDDNINRLYHAAKKTLLLNTLDIFMDCPDRERGGWLCDSLWTARAAAMMLSDPRVEREFIENFLLTPADGMFHGFFPEVYPANKPSYKDMTGITTWSFWLMCELCEYVERTGDVSLNEEFAPRVAAFVEGSQTFIGKSGLLENLPWLFIDWSLSNHGEYQQPISTPANALYAYMLTRLGQLYGRSDWTELGSSMRDILRNAILKDCDLGLASLVTFPDSFEIDGNGDLQGRGKISETGMATALWAGLFLPGEAPLMDAFVRDCMGPAPKFASNPSIGKSQLFIGLCIRLDMLTRFGAYGKMYEDMLAIFEPQLKEGPGTLWENESIDTSSRCHGFVSHAGVHLMRDVLGLGMPVVEGDSRCIHIAPHICGLRWARGTVETPHGLVAVSWRYDGESFTLHASLPAGYEAYVTLPREARGLYEEKVNVSVVTRPEKG